MGTESFNLAPRITANYTIEGYPLVKVEAIDRAKRPLKTEADFYTSIYFPFLQYFTKYGDEIAWKTERVKSTDPTFYVDPKEREIDVRVRLYDKMPQEVNYSKYDEGQIHISIPPPKISKVTIVDCRRREEHCGDLGGGGLEPAPQGAVISGSEIYEPIQGEVKMTVHLSQNWVYLSKIEVYASLNSPVEISESTYICSYFPTSINQIHQISISNLEPYLDYFITLIPYDNVGQGEPYEDAYGYLCPMGEVESCLQAECVNFLVEARGEEMPTIQQSTAFGLAKTEEPIEVDSFEIANWQTVKYLMQGKSTSGATYYSEYCITANYLGDAVGESVGGQHMSMKVSKMMIEAWHFMNAGSCILMAKAWGEGVTDDPHPFSFPIYDVRDEGKKFRESILREPFKMIFGDTIQRYNWIKEVKFMVSYPYYMDAPGNFKSRDRITIGKKVYIGKDPDDKPIYKYGGLLYSKGNAVLEYEYDKDGKVKFAFVKFRITMDEDLYELLDLEDYKLESDKLFLVVEKYEPSGTYVPYKEEDGVNIFYYGIDVPEKNRFLLPESIHLLTSYIASETKLTSFNLFDRTYSYPYQPVTIPQEPRDESNKNDFPDPTLNYLVKEEGIKLRGNVFDEVTGRRGKLDKIGFRIVRPSNQIGTPIEKVRINFFKTDRNNRISYYASSDFAELKLNPENLEEHLVFSGFDIPYDGNSTVGIVLKFEKEDDTPFTFTTKITDKKFEINEKKPDIRHWMIISERWNGDQKIVEGRRLDAFAHSSPYYTLKNPISIKAFKTSF